MAVGRILTAGLGSFGGAPFLLTLGLGSLVSPIAVDQPMCADSITLVSAISGAGNFAEAVVGISSLNERVLAAESLDCSVTGTTALNGAVDGTLQLGCC